MAQPPTATFSLDERPDRSGQDIADAAVTAAPYDPSRDRERKRGQIALRLILLLFLVCLAPYLFILAEVACMAANGKVSVCGRFNPSGLKDLSQLFVTPVVGLVGAVTGFYFGEKAT